MDDQNRPNSAAYRALLEAVFAWGREQGLLDENGKLVEGARDLVVVPSDVVSLEPA